MAVPPPKHLSPAAQDWWRKIVAEYSLTDAASLLVLQTALEAFSRAAEAREIIDREGAVIRDRFDQLKPHPATVIERDSRSALVQAMKALGLQEEIG